MRVVRWVVPFVALTASACTINAPGLQDILKPKAAASALPGKSSGGSIDLKVSSPGGGLEATTAPLTAAEIAGSFKPGTVGGESTTVTVTALPVGGEATGRGVTINGWAPGKAAVGTELPVKGFYSPRDPDKPYATLSYGENGLLWHGTGGTVAVTAIAGKAVTLTLRGVTMGPAAAGGVSGGAGTFTFVWSFLTASAKIGVSVIVKRT